jgi:hypothetical protein
MGVCASPARPAVTARLREFCFVQPSPSVRSYFYADLIAPVPNRIDCLPKRDITRMKHAVARVRYFLFRDGVLMVTLVKFSI